MRSLENKVPPPLLALFFGILMWGASFALPRVDMPDTWRFTLTGVLFLISGLYGFPAFRAFGRAGTTINPVQIETVSALVTTGIYRYTRNPMYVGLTVLLLAWTCFLSAPWTLLGPVIFVLLITRLQIMPEERVMRAKFGDEYTAYQQRVRRWL